MRDWIIVYEVLSLIVFIPLTIITFILILKDDIYVFGDVFVMVILFLVDIYIFIANMIKVESLDDLSKYAGQTTVLFRVFMFYYRMKSIRWKLKRLVQKLKLSTESKKKSTSNMTPLELVVNLITYNGQQNEYLMVHLEELYMILKRESKKTQRKSRNAFWKDSNTFENSTMAQ